MLCKRTIFTALFVAAMIAPVDRLAAQNPPRDPQSQDEGGRRFNQDGQRGRGNGPRGFGRRGRGPDMDGFYDRVAQELALDEDQKAQLEEIRAAQRERMESFRQRREAIRQAEDDGDQARADQLREEMRSEFEQNVGRRRGFMEETIQSIDGILTEDQRTQFATLQQTMRTEREQQMRQRFESRYERIAEDLGLDDDQRQVLEDIKAAQIEQMEEFRGRWEAVREAYDNGNDALGDQLREELVGEMREGGGPRQFMNQVWDELDPVLTDDQRVLAQQMRDERGPGRGRGGRNRPDANAETDSDTATEVVEQETGESRVMQDGGVVKEAPTEPGDDLQSSLELTNEQLAGFSALQAQHKQKSAALTTKMTALQEQIAAAEKEGDTEAIERLNGELAAQQALFAAEEDNFYSQLDGMLNDDQKASLAEYRADQQVDEDLKDIPADLRTVLRAAMRLKLDRSQKEQVREMTKQAKTELRKARELDKKNRDRNRTAEMALANRFKTRIRNILTTEQSLKYTENLDRMTPRRTKKPTRGI
ncbi:MAG: Spy/CpxP family protein refolding chaperone [Phycisphaerales bacterium]|nr:Spy/CpxP family protein refolding chaperone [Phycisphaerales bacterium]